MSYRLDMVTDSVAEAVRHAGGLIFDQVRAGWRVVVVTDDAAHVTALTILGTRTQDPGHIDDSLHNSERVARTRVLSIAKLAANERRAAAEISEVEPDAQLLFWGPALTSEATGLLHPVRHELSPAARVFKAHALGCAGMDSAVESSEQFWATQALTPDLFDGLLPDEPLPQVRASGTRARSPAPNLVGGSPHG